MQRLAKDETTQLTAVCDVYEPNLEAGLSVAKGKAKAYWRYQELLNAKDIDIVIIATPEHWHSQMVLDALAAGKDVYVEKPICHTPEQWWWRIPETGLPKAIWPTCLNRF
jgi:predicted dehydrogenase